MKTVFITGANRGLGKGFVDYFLDQGFHVFAGIRNFKNIPKKYKNNPNLTIIQIDVSNDILIRNTFKTVKEHTDHLDYIINNAGLNKDSATDNHKEKVCKLKTLDRESLLKMFNVNTISPMLIIKIFLPLCVSNPSFIINISSCRASYHDEFENSTGNYGYRSSKIALNMMTYCSLVDLPKNVKTFAVHPGSVKTDMNPNGVENPYTQAEKVINITKNWKDKFNGAFLRYDGKLYPL